MAILGRRSGPTRVLLALALPGLFVWPAICNAIVFQRTELAVGGAPHFVAIGDFNEDGFADLGVAKSIDSSVMVFEGHGDGTFSLGATIPAESVPLFMVADDFNRDGHLDLVISNFSAAS